MKEILFHDRSSPVPARLWLAFVVRHNNNAVLYSFFLQPVHETDAYSAGNKNINPYTRARTIQSFCGVWSRPLPVGCYVFLFLEGTQTHPQSETSEKVVWWFFPARSHAWCVFSYFKPFALRGTTPLAGRAHSTVTQSKRAFRLHELFSHLILIIIVSRRDCAGAAKSVVQPPLPTHKHTHLCHPERERCVWAIECIPF